MEDGVYTKEVVLCNTLEDKKDNGIIRLHAGTPFPILENLIDGYFSFVLYQEGADDPNNFIKSMNKPLIFGIDFYINMLHTETMEDRLNRWGMIVYTDIHAYEYLRKLFPFELYPKLIIAVVIWPLYSHKDGRVDYSILRCLRFQAMELFPTKPICARDSDTIFHVTTAYYEKHKKHKDEIISLLRKWELAFLEAWIASYTPEELEEYNRNPRPEGKIDKKVVLGSSNQYRTEWHVDVPYPIPFGDGMVEKYKLAKFFKREEYPPMFVGWGLYAGFVNIGADKSGIEDIWKICVKYLVERYTMIKDKHGHSHASDMYSHKILGSVHGKDEKLLMFAVLPYTLQNTYIMYIEYPISHPSLVQVEEDPSVPPEIQTNTMIRPGYVQAAIKYKNKDTKFPSASDEFHHIYSETVKKYNDFLKSWTPKTFYEAIEKYVKDIHAGDIHPSQYFMKPYLHPTKYNVTRSNKTHIIPSTPGKNSRNVWKKRLTRRRHYKKREYILE
jgi:hypothetical protein